MSFNVIRKSLLPLLLAAGMTFAVNNGFTKVDYKGAFGLTNWAANWTALQSYGILKSPVTAQNTVTVTDGDITAGNSYYWTADNTYLLDGKVFIEEGATLYIEAGTVIKGKPGSGEQASALIVARGGKIYAEGTADRPIIMTAESDDVSNPVDVAYDTQGLWGGLIVLGRATINVVGGENNIEGIPTTEPRGLYGGNDDDDDSGVIRYVSIRHGGAEIGEGNEINGLTLGGVGRGTTIEYVEVYANKDDGFEWFGGTVNGHHLIAAFCGDDGFDMDEGFRGKLQFIFAIQHPDFGNYCGEHDGAPKSDVAAEPMAYARIYNATYLGSGKTSSNGDQVAVLRLRENWGGFYRNSIFADYNGYGVRIDDKTTPDSRTRLDNGGLLLENNIWFGLNGYTLSDSVGMEGYTQAYLQNSANGNVDSDPLFAGIGRSQQALLDPRVSVDGAAYDNLAAFPAGDDFFTRVPYKGAFGATNWAANWTALAAYGVMKMPVEPEQNTITVSDGDIQPGGTYVWTADNTYLLEGKVFVDAGATLFIEAGTVIKGKPGSGEQASALIVARGAKIHAEGTADRPIIFTSESDDINNPVDVAYDTPGLWGGLIVLGRATINVVGGENNIEGIPTTEPRGLYGGNDDDDDSGVIRYVSIRHGGAEIGEGNEINGLTLGGVGRGTTIEYVEVYANKDDGFEWFGGTVNGHHLIAAFCGDDGFDMDEGLRNRLQFTFVIQHPDFGNYCGEHDGAPKSDVAAEPRAYPVTYNATFLGSGQSSSNGDQKAVFRLRENWGGVYNNSIFGDYNGYGITMDDKTSPDSRSRLDAGEITFHNNIWFKVGSYGVGDSIGQYDYVQNYLGDAANGNVDADNPSTLLSGIGRDQSGKLDPRPQPGGEAFGNNTAYDDYITAIERDMLAGIPVNHTLEQNYPNPFNPSTTIRFQIPRGGQVTLTVYSLTGRKVATLVDGVYRSGSYNVKWDASNLASGMYIYRLVSGRTVLSKRMLLIK